MVFDMLQEMVSELEQLRKRFDGLCDILQPETYKRRKVELEERMRLPDFYQSAEAESVIAELKNVTALLDGIKGCERLILDADTLVELLRQEEDEEMLDELRALMRELQERVGGLWRALLFSGKHDGRSVYLSIHAGAGGRESCDWASMLLRMYLRYVERKGLRGKLLYLLTNEEGGVKSATVYVEGRQAYGYLRSEAGVHRLVRLSPFDAAHRRHTSFASVDVIPEIDEQTKLDIRKEDLRIETFRSSGPGGQHVNVTDSAVRITHIPTGIVVSCQQERSQYANRKLAMGILRAKLYQLEEQRRQKELERLQGEKGEAAWGNQIRSYILHPYTLIKDHRTGVETTDAKSVLDGRLDEFVEAFLKEDYKKRSTAQMNKADEERKKK